MSRALFVLVVMLGLPGFLPALAAVRRSPALFFLAPLIGAAMAAVAVEFVIFNPAGFSMDQLSGRRTTE